MMITGIEAAGLALALLPLMLNQIDNYVQGLQTMKSFRTRRYREHLESCAAMLSGQQAILINTIGLALGDVVPAEELCDLMRGPEGRPSNDPKLDDALRSRLGHSYNAFAAMMSEAAKILEELSSKLEMEATDPAVVGFHSVP